MPKFKRKIVATEYLTLDGIFEDPGGAEKTKYGGWSFDFWNKEAAKFKSDELYASDALLLGRVTYQGFAKAWPSIKDDYGFADKMNSIPKYVVSTTLKNAHWDNSTIISKNIAKTLLKLKNQPGKDILVAGSSILVQNLIKHNLIDEIRLMIHPVILGNGKHFFKDDSHKTILKLVDTKAFKTGIVVLTYKLLQK